MQELNRTTAQQEQIQKQKVTVTGGIGNQLNALIAWGVIFLIALSIIAFCLWQFGGFIGKAIDTSVLVIGCLCIGWFLWTWAANRLYHTQRLATNSRVIETNNVTVWFDGPDNYVNFTAEIAAAANPYIPPEKVIELWQPPTFEENADKSVYEARKRGETWEQIAENYRTTVAKARTSEKNHIARLEQGRIF
jgi:hypothetical protein